MRRGLVETGGWLSLAAALTGCGGASPEDSVPPYTPSPSAKISVSPTPETVHSVFSCVPGKVANDSVVYTCPDKSTVSVVHRPNTAALDITPSPATGYFPKVIIGTTSFPLDTPYSCSAKVFLPEDRQVAGLASITKVEEICDLPKTSRVPEGILLSMNKSIQPTRVERGGREAPVIYSIVV